MQRRIVATLIVETEAGPLGGDVVESPGGLSLTKGRQRLRMRFAPQTTLPPAPLRFAQPEAGRPRVFLRQAQDKLTLRVGVSVVAH